MVYEIIPTIAAGLTLFGCLVLIWYYLSCYQLFNKATPVKPTEDKQIPVSIIICARNEKPFLETHLPQFLTLDYPDYEVILMNDC